MQLSLGGTGGLDNHQSPRTSLRITCWPRHSPGGCWGLVAAAAEWRSCVVRWVDVWASLKPDEPGLTFDGQTNPVCVRDPYEQMRYDRVMLKGTSSFCPIDICMVGTAPINEDGLKPSDHYGLQLLLGQPSR